jgi:hypothetical protein
VTRTRVSKPAGRSPPAGRPVRVCLDPTRTGYGSRGSGYGLAPWYPRVDPCPTLPMYTTRPNILSCCCYPVERLSASSRRSIPKQELSGSLCPRRSRKTPNDGNGRRKVRNHYIQTSQCAYQHSHTEYPLRAGKSPTTKALPWSVTQFSAMALFCCSVSLKYTLHPNDTDGKKIDAAAPY